MSKNFLPKSQIARQTAANADRSVSFIDVILSMVGTSSRDDV
jgi:hypothetical protein